MNSDWFATENWKEERYAVVVARAAVANVREFKSLLLDRESLDPGTPTAAAAEAVVEGTVTAAAATALMA